ncbi:hypothetical protein EG240_12430 [Paenimyroides tangerinum]|uniref:Uncharacterized protein n=1 Tax=Paenimyroides tangerinum TaxID=2488728 RepID=A0A3P3W268_9FLAO|nr:hypothetical protein [Paenimyroides tangerinum]RRJ89171.1 hypothetical protein EG240_12430 [Paenimyroides tangerinum]
MKRNFLIAVAIIGLCSSCETDNEFFTDSQQKTNYALQRSYHTANFNYETYQLIIEGFEYHKALPYHENVMLYEKYVNSTLYEIGLNESYKMIDYDILQKLLQADEMIISEFDYSSNAKILMEQLLKEGSYDASVFQKLNATEQSILNTMLALSTDNKGDDRIDDKRTIAFAYGAQFSFTEAILYAGAVALHF